MPKAKTLMMRWSFLDLRISFLVVLPAFLFAAFFVVVQKVEGIDLAFPELFDLKTDRKVD